MAEETHARVETLANLGGEGGAVGDEALARYQVSIAKARLATAMGVRAQAEKWYESAVRAAEAGVKATQNKYDAGNVGLERLVFAQQQLAEARIHLIRIQSE